MLTTLPATYTQAMDWLHSLSTYGIRLGLERMAALLDELGHPEIGPGIVHVTGTNGKGSTSAYLAAMLRSAGYRVGLYTSPHLEHFEERIQINGEPVSQDMVLEAIRAVIPAVDRLRWRGIDPPTEFEAITALGWLIFRRAEVELVVLEVGMGGRFDSTNVIPAPMVSVITGVALDHTDRLGHTVEEIAWDKAGILKPGVPAIVAGPPAAQSVIREVAGAVRAPLFQVGANSPITFDQITVHAEGSRFSLTTPWTTLPDLLTPLIGRHQVQNAGVAISALLAAQAHFPSRLALVTPDSIRRGIASARWPGRLEVCRRSPLVILDGAHNPEGASSLAASLRELFPNRAVHLVTAVVKDKDVTGVLKPLLSLAQRIYVTRVSCSKRALPPESLRELVAQLAPEKPAQAWVSAPLALQAALDAAAPGDLVLVAGSLYLVGEVRKMARTGGNGDVPATGNDYGR